MHPDIHIIPEPTRLVVHAGRFVFAPRTRLAADPAVAGLADTLCKDLERTAGVSLALGASGDSPVVELRIDPALAALGSEGYRLVVEPTRVRALAAEPAGLFYAIQSLRQMLPPSVFGAGLDRGLGPAIPCAEIEDVPRFVWRGAMLDCVRHFMGKDFVLRFIDLLALHKLNRFHWHLTDDQGWRVEIRKYPRLAQVGALRPETMLGHWDGTREGLRFDGIPHGGFYSQTDIREVVAYARARSITVVPEIEMPGHARAAVAAYPELGNTGRNLEVATHWGVHEHVYNVEESTISFLADVLDEVMGLFPGPYVHIGGDECPKTEWRDSPAAQARMRELGLQDQEGLQSWFVRRMDDHLTKAGRRLVGWDEILEGGLAENATVMSWRGEEGGIAAANAGHDVVMTPTQYTYLDHYQSQDTGKEPLAIGGYLPLERVYGYEPLPAAIAPDRAHHVLGTQGQLWSEYIATPEHCEYMAFPRLCALAEAAWRPSGRTDYAGFLERLRTHLVRLDGLGVNYRKLDEEPGSAT
jgi:hexosaminidase